MAPADDYVADFVAGVSRLSLVTAARIMQPINGSGGELDRAPRVAPSATLDALVDIACDTEGPIAVADGIDVLGYISKRSLLRGIQGRA